MNIAAILLAAGRSRRFGREDKLAMPLAGSPLGLHAARTLARLPLQSRYVVCAGSFPACAGFVVVQNDHPETGLGRSIALGLSAAREAGADAVLLALADMPFVPLPHFERLLQHHAGAATIAASTDGTTVMPPALFGSEWFDALLGLSGDVGARSLLRHAKTVRASPDELLDIDHPDDLVRARAVSLDTC